MNGEVTMITRTLEEVLRRHEEIKRENGCDADLEIYKRWDNFWIAQCVRCKLYHILRTEDALESLARRRI